jgi:hypothetical protein
MPSRERAPWSDEDHCPLADLAGDGYPAPAIAARIGRSVNSIQAMLSKIGVRTMRKGTIAFQVQLLPDVVTLNSGCARSPASAA